MRGALKLSNILGPGKFDNERLSFKVLRNCDLGEYAVFRVESLGDGSISTKVHNTYWFPEFKVKTGDTVVLYTKKSTSKVRESEEGSKIYFFYFGLKDAIWVGQFTPVLAYVPQWDTL